MLPPFVLRKFSRHAHSCALAPPYSPSSSSPKFITVPLPYATIRLCHITFRVQTLSTMISPADAVKFSMTKLVGTYASIANSIKLYDNNTFSEVSDCV